MSTATFKVRRNELLSILKKFKLLMKSARRKEATLEVTIVNSRLRLVIPGIEIQIAATF